MSEPKVTFKVLEDRILITQLPPSGRKTNADIIEIGFKEWVTLSDAINKALKDAGIL